MSDKNYFSLQNEEKCDLGDKIGNKVRNDTPDFKKDQLKTIQNGIVLDKFDTERNFSVKKNKKIDYNSSNFSSDLKLVYKTISVQREEKNTSKNQKKNKTIEVKLEKNLNEAQKKNVNFNELYSRLMKFNDERKAALEEMKKQKEIGEDKTLRKIPQISERSKNLVRNIEEPIYERCVKFKNQVEKKRNNQQKEKEEKIKKHEDEIIKEVRSHRLGQEKINEKIANLLVWDSKKKTKLIHLKEDLEKKKLSDYTFQPKINKTPNRTKASCTPTKDGVKEHPLFADHGFTERLYVNDVEKRKLKHEQLESIYTPSFEPMTNKTRLKKKQDSKKEEGKSNKYGQKNKNMEKIKQNLNTLYNRALDDSSLQAMFKERFNFHKKKEGVNETETEETKDAEN
jgi:hypothetical protein